MLQLTPTQRDIYLEGKLFGGAVNNIGGYQKYPVSIDVARFARARDRLLNENDAYRLRFLEGVDGCVPVVSIDAPPAMQVLDLADEVDAEAAALAWIQCQFERPFADIAECVFQDALIRLSAQEYWYFAKAHHLIMDGWGFALQMQRCLELYRELPSDGMDGAGAASFAEYMAEQAGYPSTQRYLENRDYWMQQYGAYPRRLFSPVKRAESGTIACSRRTSLVLDQTLFQAVESMSRSLGANVVAVFYAVLYVYFARAYDSQEVVVASPVHNRRTANEKAIIGSLVNVNAHRITASMDMRFGDLVRETAQLLKRNHRHSRFPIGDIGRALREHFQTIEPLSQISFNYQRLDFQLTVEGTAVETHYLSHNHEQVPLTFVVCEYGENQDVVFHLDYRADFFDDEEAAALLARIHGLLHQAVDDTDREIGRLRLPSHAEWRTMVGEWNATDAPLYDGICLHGLFERQVLRTPDRVAVVGRSESLTYQQLNKRAERICGDLRALGAGPDCFVGVCHSRTADLIVAILGVLKAGAAYVPIDPAYPAARVQYILDDARIRIVLADEAGAAALPAGERTLIDVRASLGVDDIVSDKDHAACAPVEVSSCDLAYVIYTSGSTGNPKGVMIEHRNAAAFVQWALQAYSVDDLACVLAATSICFDLSVFEMFVPLSMGGQIMLADNALALRDGDYDGITLVNTVPSAIKGLLEAGAIPGSVRCINLAGELLRQDLVDALYNRHGARVYDLYGPSEDTTYSTWTLRERGGCESIGRPVSNTRVYVMDRNGQLLPPGLTGELYIGGAGLARGYLNQQALTDDKFVFSETVGERVYRTGDLVKWGVDRQLRYIGRRDNQVKIRGHRIELGEIESRVLQHPLIRDCSVLALKDASDDLAVVAYLVSDDAVIAAETRQRELTASVVAHLSATLPGYMVPVQFIHLAVLPLTPNGKVDRKALPVPGLGASQRHERVAPRNSSEQALCRFWIEVLKTDCIGVHDSFFSLGGNSLQLLRLATIIERECGVRLDLSTLFDAPTIEMQAQLLDHERGLVRMLTAVSTLDDERCVEHISL